MKRRRMWEYLSLLIRAALLPEGDEKESAEAQMDMYWQTLDADELAFINYVAEKMAKDLS